MATFELLKAPPIIGAWTFAGSNSVGPIIGMNLPRVLCVPTKGLELVQDKYGDMTFSGMVLYDLDAASFGTLSVTGDEDNPSTSNYYIGKGIATFNGADLGNASAITFTPDVKTVEHYTSREGEKRLDDVQYIQRGGKIEFTLDEYSIANLKLYTIGI